MQLTQSIRKLVYSLDKAKARRESHLFVAEGTKCVLDTLDAFDLFALFATKQWLETHPLDIDPLKVCIAANTDIERMSHLSTPPQVLAVYHIPERTFSTNVINGLTLALDCIQDPGNLGTIIRVADWMGIHTILASKDTADAFAPKTVQATMGSLSRVNVYYVDLPDTLAAIHNTNIYGTFLDGDNIYSAPLDDNGIIVMGNEGRGISTDVAQLVNRRLFIPPYPTDAVTGESLNVSIATAITLAEFRRRALNQ